MNKLNSSKAEKDFVNFLSSYVKAVEKKLKQFESALIITMTPNNEEDFGLEDKGIFLSKICLYRLIDLMEDIQSSKVGRLKPKRLARVGSSTSIFSDGKKF